MRIAELIERLERIRDDYGLDEPDVRIEIMHSGDWDIGGVVVRQQYQGELKPRKTVASIMAATDDWLTDG
jgi:hypothetical protein